MKEYWKIFKKKNQKFFFENIQIQRSDYVYSEFKI